MKCTETNKKAGTWLREFCPCSCLTALPGLATVLLSKIYVPFCSPLYISLQEECEVLIKQLSIPEADGEPERRVQQRSLPLGA